MQLSAFRAHSPRSEKQNDQDQIYKDTLRRLRDRRDFYREALEAAISRRIEVWEKHEIARLTPGQLASNLNVLVIKLQGTNRQDKESLKFFRDSGGNIVAHFPPENEPEKHKELKQRIPNLDMVENNEARGRHLVATSVGNLVRLSERRRRIQLRHRRVSATSNPSRLRRAEGRSKNQAAGRHRAGRREQG
ncbi:MAG: hypothetical protein DME26_09185 [Verrucomicrobia bacterium]|nr:MAG: hypothetical protein DME26_09185 [Verrucomicrobiota bacterium]